MFRRRTFIKNTGILMAGLPLIDTSFPTPGSGKKKLGVCIVGLGSYSTENLAPALMLTKYCQLTGIVTGSAAKIPVWQKRYNIPDKNIYNYQNMEQVANNPAIDIVYIVVPTGLHAALAIKAANAGKHVWCEKPMAKTSIECLAIIEACKKNNVRLSIGYRMQHEPNTRKIIEWAKQKPFMKMKSVTAEIGYDMVPDPKIWRMSEKLGGGFLYDLGIYAVNGLRYAAGEEPVAITATHETKRPEIFTETSETTSFRFDFPSGLVGFGQYSAGNTMNMLKVNCERGWYLLAPFQTYTGIAGLTSSGLVLKDQIKNQQANQMDENALAIMSNSPVLVPGEEGIRDIIALEAINHAAVSRKTIQL